MSRCCVGRDVFFDLTDTTYQNDSQHKTNASKSVDSSTSEDSLWASFEASLDAIEDLGLPLAIEFARANELRAIARKQCLARQADLAITAAVARKQKRLTQTRKGGWRYRTRVELLPWNSQLRQQAGVRKTARHSIPIPQNHTVATRKDKVELPTLRARQLDGKPRLSASAILAGENNCLRLWDTGRHGPVLRQLYEMPPDRRWEHPWLNPDVQC